MQKRFHFANRMVSIVLQEFDHSTSKVLKWSATFHYAGTLPGSFPVPLTKHLFGPPHNRNEKIYKPLPWRLLVNFLVTVVLPYALRILAKKGAKSLLLLLIIHLNKVT